MYFKKLYKPSFIIGLFIVIISAAIFTDYCSRYRIPDEYYEEYLRVADAIEYRKEIWNNYRKQHPLKNFGVRLPNLVCIGVKKCGTTAITNFLRMHPDVKSTKAKIMETRYFKSRKYFEENLDYYRSLFEISSDTDVVLEKTGSYFFDANIGIPRRIKEALPNAKLLLIVCDPTKRAFSDYAHERTREKEVTNKYTNFDDYVKKIIPKIKENLNGINYKELNITKQEKDIITAGLYSEYLPVWYQYFNKSSILIVNGEDFLSHPGPTMRKLQSFLGLKIVITSEDFVRHPQTGLYCLRPWWEDKFRLDAEFSRLDGWESNLHCLPSNKGRTRSNSTTIRPMNFKSYFSLRKFYDTYNKRFYKLIGYNMRW